MSTIDIRKSVFPIFIIEHKNKAVPRAHTGTGFFISEKLLLTCWHCVNLELRGNEEFMLWNRSDNKNYVLQEPMQDENNTDIAIAYVDINGIEPLQMCNHELDMAQNVWSFGFPLVDKMSDVEIGHKFSLNPRAIKGYVMRSFNHNHLTYPENHFYELDMPAPEGLSGAPIVKEGTKEVASVVTGVNDVRIIEQWSSVDPDTGEKSPEISRIYSFTTGYHTSVLSSVTNKWTEKKPLSECWS